MPKTPQEPEEVPAQTPTEPLPQVDPAPVPMNEESAAPETGGEAASAPPWSPPPTKTGHRVTDGAVAAIVVGVLLFCALSFGLGWTARGVAQRVAFAHHGMMMGRPFGGPGSFGIPGSHGQRRGNWGPGQGMGGRGNWGPNQGMGGGRTDRGPDGSVPGMPGDMRNLPQSVPPTIAP